MVDAPALPGVLGGLAPLLDRYGYLAVAALITLEDFGVPVPGEAILVAAAVYAGAGQLNIVAVMLIAVAAAIRGDSIGYAIGRFGGRRLVLRFGRYVLLSPRRLATAERFFTATAARSSPSPGFIEGLRQFNGIIAGTTRMPWPRFVAFNALGATLWVGGWAGLGYFAGGHISTIYGQVSRYQRYLLAAAGPVLVGLLLRHVVRSRRAPELGDHLPDRP